MYSRVIAIIMSIVSVFSSFATQVFSEVQLKNELAKGNYESPYIVRPLEEITVNGVSIEEYSVAFPDGAIYTNAADTLIDEIYKACGIKISKSEADTKAFVIEDGLLTEEQLIAEMAAIINANN